ncbi:MAG: hypothetical protein ACKO9S_07885 [Bacteroidota bacterium]
MKAVDLVKTHKIPLSKIKKILGMFELMPFDELNNEECTKVELFLKNLNNYPRIKKTKRIKKKRKSNPLNPNGYIYPKTKFISTGM